MGLNKLCAIIGLAIDIFGAYYLAQGLLKRI